MLIQDKEKLYAELCGVLAKQPGPEIFDQIVSYARSLNQKSQQIKAMASELNMFQVGRIPHLYTKRIILLLLKNYACMCASLS